MPTRPQHLNALRDHLNAVLSGCVAAEVSERRIGLHAEAHASLNWLRHSLCAGRDSIDTALVLAFGEHCSGRHMPRRLRSPLDGSWIPVQSVRGGYAGRAHSPESVKVVNETISADSALVGTLGGILRWNKDPSQLLALTAGHVVGSSSEAAAGNLVSLGLDGESLMMGRLFNWSPDFMNVPPATLVDAGLVRISTQMLEPLARRPGEWPVRSATPFANSELRLRTRNQVFSGGAPVFLDCRVEVTSDETKFYTVKGALCWNVSEPPVGGDSGAPIWNADDELIAIHAGGAPDGAERNSVAVLIDPILRWAGATVVTRGEPLAQSAPPKNGALLSGAVAVAPAASPPAQPPPQPGAPAPAPAPAQPTQSTPEIVTLARTMWGEARSDGARGMGAVAHVVLNRRVKQKYWGKTIDEVCRKRFQFSCWNDNDPNLPLLQRVTEADSLFSQALKLAQELASLDESLRAARDPTLGATHYYARQLRPPPRWARGKTPCAQLGNHLFFRDIA